MTRPWNVFVAPGSPAERALRTAEIASGIAPTPAHDLIYHGGKTIAALNFTNLYVGGAASWDAGDIQNIDRALAAALSDAHLNNVMSQYFSGDISTTFQPSRILPGAKPAKMSQANIETLLSQLHSQGDLSSFDLTVTVFCVMLPSGTVLSTQGADSKHGLGGYHGSVHVGQETVYYAAGAYSETEPDGTTNGIPVFDQPWKNVVATFYHELNEARTDADVEDAIQAGSSPNADKFLGWMSAQGEECGDFPVSEANPLTQIFQEVALADGSGTVPVQFQYSNAVHGPEGPIDAPDPKASLTGHVKRHRTSSPP